MEKGMEKGRVEGKHEANTETAQRLLAMDFLPNRLPKLPAIWKSLRI